MVHDLALENAERPHRADPRQGRHRQRDLHGERQRHLLLLGARPSTRPAWRAGSKSRTSARVASIGVAPSVNGRPLNLDFEIGHARQLDGDRRRLRGRQDGRTRKGRRRDRLPGSYWVSSGAGGNARKGTLTSAPFRVTAPVRELPRLRRCVREHARRAGARRRQDRHLHDLGRAISPRCGRRSSTCARTPARTIVVRLVDDETGATVAAYLRESPWAHINFDNFRFHDSRPFFPNEIAPVGDEHAAVDGSGAATRGSRLSTRRRR